MHQTLRVLGLSVLISIFCFTFPKFVQASILINEFSASTNPEWIELYNDGETDIDLTNYFLEDGNSSKTDDIVLSGLIAAKGFVVFEHSDGWLNNGGDTVKLYNNASPSAIIDQYSYTNSDSTKSIARIPNGGENWQQTENVTKNSSNPNPTSAPTQTPTPTITSTPTQTAQATITPTPKPTPTKTATAKPTIFPSPTEEADNEKETELPFYDLTNNGQDDNSTEQNQTKNTEVMGFKTESKIPAISYIFIFFGILFLGYGGYMIYNKRHEFFGQKG